MKPALLATKEIWPSSAYIWFKLLSLPYYDYVTLEEASLVHWLLMFPCSETALPQKPLFHCWEWVLWEVLLLWDEGANYDYSLDTSPHSAPSVQAILSIYLKKKLGLTEDLATIIYHTFSMFCYFTPIFGSILADTFLGKYKTIVYISIIYVLGHLLKTLAAIPTLGVPPLWVAIVTCI